MHMKVRSDTKRLSAFWSLNNERSKACFHRIGTGFIRFVENWLNGLKVIFW